MREGNVLIVPYIICSSERAKWQAAFDDIPQETRSALWYKWTGNDDSIKTIPEQDLPCL